MRVMGIDTASSELGVAVVDERGVVAECQVRRGRSQGQRLAVMIRALLSDADLEWGEIEGIACSAGPGSFTGVRIGMAMAKAIAYARGIPILGVTSLEALAWGARGLGPQVCAVLGAGRGQVYAAVLAATDDDVRLRGPIWHGPPAGVARLLGNSSGPVVVCGDGVPAQLPAVSQGRHRLRGPVDQDRVRAAAVAGLGRVRLVAGMVEHPFAVRPSYVAEVGGGGRGTPR